MDLLDGIPLKGNKTGPSASRRSPTKNLVLATDAKKGIKTPKVL